jgi:hypothetical protein
MNEISLFLAIQRERASKMISGVQAADITVPRWHVVGDDCVLVSGDVVNVYTVIKGSLQGMSGAVLQFESDRAPVSIVVRLGDTDGWVQAESLMALRHGAPSR